MGYSPWGLKELDTTERLHFLSFFQGGAQERLRLLPSALPAEVAQARCWDWAFSRDSPGWGPGLQSTGSTSGHLAWPSPHAPAILITHIWLGSDDVAAERDVEAGF